MLDSSCSETPKTKKKTAQNRPVQRFWPDSIASGVAQQQSNELTMSDGEESCPNMDNKVNSSLTGKWRVWCLWEKGDFWIFQYKCGFNLGNITEMCHFSSNYFLWFKEAHCIGIYVEKLLLLFQKLWNDRTKDVQLWCTAKFFQSVCAHIRSVLLDEQHWAAASAS